MNKSRVPCQLFITEIPSSEVKVLAFYHTIDIIASLNCQLRPIYDDLSLERWTDFDANSSTAGVASQSSVNDRDDLHLFDAPVCAPVLKEHAKLQIFSL